MKLFLFVILAITLVAVIRPAETQISGEFSASCVARNDFDSIDHCCMCDNCGRNGTSPAVSTRYLTSPTTSPLPAPTENLGSSLCMPPNGARIVADSNPDSNPDQQIPSDTTVHISELSQATPGAFTHFTIDGVVPARGHSLACSNDFIAVGSPTNSPASVQLFVKTTQAPWSVQYTLDELNAGTEFGYALSLDQTGSRFVVSDPGYSSEIGRVYVYETGYSDLLDTLEHPIVFNTGISTDTHRFGHSVAVADSTLVVGSPGDDQEVGTGIQNVGAVHLYEQVGNKWEYLDTFYPPNAVADRRFGSKVVIHGEFLLVGSQHSHSVEVYRRTRAPLNHGPDGNKDTYQGGVWQHLQTLTGHALDVHSTFGLSLAMSDNRILVGDATTYSSASAVGVVFTYEYDPAQELFIQCQTLKDDPGSHHTRFGQQAGISQDGRWVAIGAPATDVDVPADNGNLWLLDLHRGDECYGCDGEFNSCTYDDACGVCEGDNSTCKGCDGVPNSGIEEDYCGVCGGDNTTCLSVYGVKDHDEADGTTVFLGNLDGNENDFIVQATCNRAIDLVFLYAPRHSNEDLIFTITKPPSHGTFEQDPDDGDFPLTELSDDDDDVFRYTSTLLTPSPGQEDTIDIHFADVHGNEDNATLRIQLRDCYGCDGQPNSGVVVDQCGVCGGNSSECTDCAGQLNGRHEVDYCGECALPANANRTCLTVFNRQDTEVRCKHTVYSEDARWEPNYPNEVINWAITSTHTQASVSIGTFNGRITYTHNGDINYADTVHFQGRNTNGYVSSATLQITVNVCDEIGCDGEMGSGAALDPCGVCGGDGTSCVAANRAFALSPGGVIAISVGAGGALLALLLISLIVIAVIYFVCYRRQREPPGQLVVPAIVQMTSEEIDSTDVRHMKHL